MRSRLFAWIALALVFTKLQCAASCAILTCETPKSVPPCHQHHDSSQPGKPAPCSHQIIVTPAANAPSIQLLTDAVPTAIEGLRPRLVVLAEPLAIVDVSPPGGSAVSSVILRI